MAYYIRSLTRFYPFNFFTIYFIVSVLGGYDDNGIDIILLFGYEQKSAILYQSTTWTNACTKKFRYISKQAEETFFVLFGNFRILKFSLIFVRFNPA